MVKAAAAADKTVAAPRQALLTAMKIDVFEN